MQTMVYCIFMLTTVLAGAFAVTLYKNIRPSVTPLLSLSVITVVTVFFALFNKLYFGKLLCTVAVYVFLALGVKRNKGIVREKLKEFLCVSNVLFALFSLLTLIALFKTQPVFSQWDEFSFWGVAARLVFENNALYTFYPTSLVGVSSPPALPVLSYIFQHGEFSEWVCYFAYDVLFIACIDACCAPFEKKNRHIGALLFVTAYIIPFCFGAVGLADYLNTTYISAYRDMPLGIVFAGAVAVYFYASRDDVDILALIPVLSLLTLIKDMGFALSCIVIFCAFFDMLVQKKDVRIKKLNGIIAKITASVVWMFAVLLSYIGWSFHMAKVLNRNSFELGGEANMGYSQMLISGVCELLKITPRSEKYQNVLNRMVSAFSGTRIAVLGSCLVLTVFIALIFTASFIFSDKKDRIGTATLFITTLTGFVGYYVFHIFLYAYIFKGDGRELTSYSRYMMIYFVGWLIIAVMRFAFCCKDRKFADIPFTAFFVLFVLLCARYIKPYNLFFSAGENNFAERYNTQQKADFIRDSVSDDDVIWVFSADDAGKGWFIYTLEFTDNIFVKDLYIPYNDGDDYKNAQTTLYNYFIENGVTNILFDSYGLQHDKYAELFDENPGFIGPYSVAYYKVNYSDDWFSFSMIKGGTVVD